MNYHLPVQHRARGDRGSIARFHRRDGLVRLFAAGIGGGFLSEPAHNVRRALSRGRRHRRPRPVCLPTNCRSRGSRPSSSRTSRAAAASSATTTSPRRSPTATPCWSPSPRSFRRRASLRSCPTTSSRISRRSPRSRCRRSFWWSPSSSRSSPSRNWSIIAKANPGKLPYGTFGNATTSHLYGELLKKNADIDMTHVPYRGSAPLTNDLLANTVTSAFVDLTTASAQIKAGKLRALAVGGEKRRTALPDVPTIGELGYPGFEIEGWLGVFVPAANAQGDRDEAFRRTRPHHRLARGRRRASRRSASSRWADRRKRSRKSCAAIYDRWADVVKATGVKGE